jgi:rhodanese-related sulfurtransferase
MSADSREGHKSGLTDLDAKEVDRLLSAHKALLVDVREPGEYEAERIPGALLFPLSTFDPAALPFDSAKQLIFQCGSGKRSADAARRAMATGVAHTCHLAGGIKAWKEAGLAIITFDPATGKPRKVGG